MVWPCVGGKSRMSIYQFPSESVMRSAPLTDHTSAYNDLRVPP